MIWIFFPSRIVKKSYGVFSELDGSICMEVSIPKLDTFDVSSLFPINLVLIQEKCNLSFNKALKFHSSTARSLYSSLVSRKWINNLIFSSSKDKLEICACHALSTLLKFLNLAIIILRVVSWNWNWPAMLLHLQEVFMLHPIIFKSKDSNSCYSGINMDSTWRMIKRLHSQRCGYCVGVVWSPREGEKKPI